MSCSRFRRASMRTTQPGFELASGYRLARKKFRRSISYQPFEFVEDARVPPAPGHFLLHGLHRVSDGIRRLVRPDRGQRIVNIDNLQNTSGDADVFSAKPIGIS